MFELTFLHMLADSSHALSKIILVVSIIRNSSAEGVSLLTQLLYLAVFVCRYLDLLWIFPFRSLWNTTLKIFYLASSAYIVYIMMRVFARTREKEYAWKLATYSTVASLISAPLVCMVLEGWEYTTFFEVIWTFSIILESICVLPQLLLLRQTSVPTVLDSYYLVTLGSYRFFYLLHWIAQGLTPNSLPNEYWTEVVFGIVQTALYVDFAWVYWSRQRVKLRGGGIVDSDDLSKSFLVRRFIGRRGNRNSTEEDADLADEDSGLAGQENGVVRPQAPHSARSWGPRGISVSADDTLSEHQANDAHMIDPSHFEDDGDDADAPPPPTPAKDDQPKAATKENDDDEADEATAVVGSSASEWQSGGAK